MGTTWDWLTVVFGSVFWGGCMLAWETHRRKAANLEPALLPVNIMIWTLVGLCFGLSSTFGWKALQWPLVLLTAACFVGTFIIGFLYRRERSKAFPKAFNRRQAWLRTALFFLVMLGLGLLLLKFHGLL